MWCSCPCICLYPALALTSPAIFPGGGAVPSTLAPSKDIKVYISVTQNGTCYTKWDILLDKIWHNGIRWNGPTLHHEFMLSVVLTGAGEDGGEGYVGMVVEVGGEGQSVLVQWDCGIRSWYRIEVEQRASSVFDPVSAGCYLKWYDRADLSCYSQILFFHSFIMCITVNRLGKMTNLHLQLLWLTLPLCHLPLRIWEKERGQKE